MDSLRCGFYPGNLASVRKCSIVAVDVLYVVNMKALLKTVNCYDTRLTKDLTIA